MPTETEGAEAVHEERTVGNRRTHAEARKRLRRRLEARGFSADEIAVAVAELRQRQAAERQVARVVCPSPSGKHAWRVGNGVIRCRNCGAETRSKFESRGAWIRERLRRRDGDRCTICGGTFTGDDPATIDHVRPKADGGSDGLENLRLAHATCNHVRGQGQDPRIDGRTGIPHAARSFSAD